MFKCYEDHIQVLGLCVDEPPAPGPFSPVNFHQAHSADRAMRLLAASRFDLLFVGSRLPDLSPWSFLRLMRNAHPRQKWALVISDSIENPDSLTRAFDAAGTFQSPPTTAQICRLVERMRQTAIENVLSGRFDQPHAFIPHLLAG